MSRPKQKAPAPSSAMTLYTADGGRKYLTAGERDAFLKAAECVERQERTSAWCMDPPLATRTGPA